MCDTQPGITSKAVSPAPMTSYASPALAEVNRRTAGSGMAELDTGMARP